MAWNGSALGGRATSMNSPQRDVSGASSSHHYMRGVVAGVIIVVFGSVAAWYWGRGSDTSSVNSRPEKNAGVVISQVVPRIATNRVALQSTSKQTATPKKKTLLEKLRERYGDNIPDNLKQTVYYLENPPTRTAKVPPSRGSIFRHPSEQMIADVALVEPGTLFVIQPEFDASFDRDFVNAMVDKIAINDDDSDADKALKNDVTAVKKELMRLCKETGKQPSEIMNENAKALYELGQFRRNLEDELNEMHNKSEYTDKDIEDFYAAANKMLTEKGLPGMVSPDLTRRSIRLARRERHAALEAAKNKGKEK